MILFSTSVAGSNRKVIEEGAVRIARKNGKKLRVLNLVDEMLEVAKGLNNELTPSTLLHLDKKILNVLKSTALHRINDQIRSNPGWDYIVDGHTAFWWKNGPINLLDIEDFRELKPDLFVTIISTAHELDSNLLVKKEWKDKEIDMYELLLWSELEIYTTDLISKTLGRENYLIGIGESPLTLYNLIYNPNMIKIYTSFSMEHRDSGYRTISRFIGKLRKIAIVFDPRSVDLSAYKKYGRDQRVIRIAANQTVRRDYHMIDQADMVVIHMSSLVYSSGVDSERMHAHSTGKKVLLYFPFKKYSPFTPYFVDKMFNSEGELIKKVKEIAAELPKKKHA